MTTITHHDDNTVLLRPAAAATAVPADATAPGHLPVGTRLAEFEITALVGEGGFGVVYLAWDHSLQRRVAVKEYMPAALVHRDGGSRLQLKSTRHQETFEIGLNSFINEARLLANFDHPSLMKVYRFWEANGTAYMAMPYLEGSTLKQVLAALPQPPDEAWLLGLLGPLSAALQVLHAEQCYHRDVAPDNVMLLRDPARWMLLDFGAARRVIGDMTHDLTVILKPGYAPVEQYAETPALKQGPWTDVYALAAVVHTAILGRTPPAAVGRLLNDSHVPLVQQAAGRYSPAFLAAIDHALAVRPEMRTQSMAQFRQELGLEPVAAATTHAAPPRKRVPTAAAATAATAAGLLVAALAWQLGPWAAGPAPQATVAAVGAPRPVVPAETQRAPATQALATEQPPAPATALDVPREFERLEQATAPGFAVRADTPQPRLRIGRDEFRFSVQSQADGYLYVYGHASDGTLALLVPNTASGPVRVRAGQPWQFPARDGFTLQVQDPAGPTQLLVLVSRHPRSHAVLQPRAEGPVQVLPTGVAAAALAARHPGPGSVLAGQSACTGSGPCDDAFGAAVLRFETLR